MLASAAHRSAGGRDHGVRPVCRHVPTSPSPCPRPMPREHSAVGSTPWSRDIPVRGTPARVPAFPRTSCGLLPDVLGACPDAPGPARSPSGVRFLQDRWSRPRLPCSP
ncbi:hypothetical protein STXM2123_5874 [Streptomyces sp. F-3]|nr:hypothetical protein STXM2123_5874 [Streptomyces sp. F-3]